MIILENEYLIAEIYKRGAELKHLRKKDDGHEYLWSANPAFWAKTSPVLFPIVGALKDDTYFFRGKEYRLPRHGFARDRMFEEAVISETEVAFALTDTEETRAVYPFAFQLTLRYKLVESSLVCTYEVLNPHESDVLFFSIGGHPAFAAGEGDGVTYEDHYLVFPDDEVLYCNRLEEGLIAARTRTIALENHRLPLVHSLFYEDALVMKTLNSQQITLQNDVNGRGIRFKYEDFPFFGIWAAKDANFVCLEPWCGIADHVGHHQRLEDKEGIQRLDAGQIWQRSWEVQCF